VHAKWVKGAWALAAFVPLAGIYAEPIFVYQIGYVFLLCAMYLWPASWIANQLGIEPLTPMFAVVGGVYCAVLGALTAVVLSRLFRLSVHVERRRAVVLIGIVWLPIGLFAGYRILDYKGVMSTESQCPGNLYFLKEHCADISELREQELAGFIDRSFLATFRPRGSTLSTLVTVNQMREIPASDVPDSFWRQPPVWWTITRTTAAHVYMSPGFAFEGRGHDGEHYLFIEERDTAQVFVYFQDNF
jgi:hypothetical protein